MKEVWIPRLGVLLLLLTGMAPLCIDRMPTGQSAPYGVVYALVCLGYLGVRPMRRFPGLMVATLASQIVAILWLYLALHVQRATLLFAPVVVFAFLGFYREENEAGRAIASRTGSRG